MAKRRFRSRGRFSRIRRRRRGVRSKRLTRFIKRTVRRMSEVKYATSNGLVNIDAFTGVVIRLNPTIAQGVNKNQRLGNKIRSKFFQFRAICYLLDGTSGANNLIAYIRILIVQPRILPTNGLANGPVLNEIFDINSTAADAMTSSVKNVNVRVLMDKTYSRPTYVGAGWEPGALPTFAIKKKVRLTNNVSYDQSISTLPTDPKDNYYLILLSDVPAINDQTVNMRWSSRISYVDV